MPDNSICYIVTSINNRGGGGNRSPRILIQSLLEAGYDNVIIYSNSPGKDIFDRDRYPDLENRVRNIRVKYSLKGKMIDIRKSSLMARIIRLVKYLIINLMTRTRQFDHTEFDYLIVDSMFSHFVKQKLGIVHPRSILLWRITPDSYFKFDKFGSESDVAAIFGDYHKVVFPSDAVLEDWADKLPELRERFDYLYNCIDEQQLNREFTARNETICMRSIKIACIGNLHYIKGQDIALKAFRKLRDEYDEVEFSFVGKAHDGFGERIIKAVEQEKRIEYQSYSFDVLGVLAQSDILVVPSRTEMFPRIVLEGLYAGCIVIASRIGGMRSMITEGHSGFLFKSEDYMDLYNKIAMVLEMPEEKKKELGYNAHRHYMLNYSQRKQVERLNILLPAVTS